jgi:signal transduction histidine kinase
MKTSTASVLDQSQPRHATFCDVQSPALAPGEAAGTYAAHDAAACPASALSALMDAKLAADREIQRLSARVHQLSTQLAATDERVRRMLAQEVHDAAGAALTAARFALARLETWLPADAPGPCTEALGIAKQSLDAVCEANQQAVAGLSAPQLDDGIARALADWAERFAASTSLDVTFTCAPDARLARLGEPVALAIFRVAQEALSNVARHARASVARVHIEVNAEGDARFVTLFVEDDGCGMTAAARRKPGRLGLSGMRSRCEALGGSLRITASATGGTAVRARFPLTASHAAVSPIRPARFALNS